MDVYRTQQESDALRDIAYVIRFGHFPGEDDNNEERLPTPNTSLLINEKKEENVQSKPPQCPPSPKNPFEEEDENLNPFTDDGNPFNEEDLDITKKPEIPTTEKRKRGKEDRRPSIEDRSPSKEPASPSINDQNPLSENLDSTTESQDGCSQSPTSTDGSPVPQSPMGTSKPSTSSTSQQEEGSCISRKAVKEMVCDLFNTTQFDLSGLMEEVGKYKEPPRVQLLLEELRTAGLGLQPTTGSCSPPLVFLRAAVGESSSFTTFTSTSATRATQDVLSMNVSNMYTENLLLQIWSIPGSVSMDAPTQPPMMDVLTRLIKHAKDRTNPASPFKSAPAPKDIMVNKDAATPSEARQPQEGSRVEDVDVDHSHDTAPAINIENGMDDQEDEVTPHDPAERSPSGAEGESGGSGNGSLLENSVSIKINETQVTEVTSERAGGQLFTSTPKDKSPSFQDLEVSSLSTEGTHKPLEKSKSSIDGFRKLSVNNLRASFRSNFLKNRENGHVGSSHKGDKAFDTTSLGSQASERGSEGDECSNDNSNPLNREKSRSTLSITSFTRLNRSLRLSPKKASQVLGRISGRINKVSRSETSTPEPSRRHQQLAQYVDTPPKTTEHTELTPPHNTKETPSPEDSFNPNSLTRRSLRKMFKPRSLRTFRSLGDGNAKGECTDDLPDRVDSVPVQSKQHPQNPKEIQEYLSSLGKAHVKAELLAYTNIPIKSLVGNWKKEGWVPLTMVRKESAMSSQKKKKVTRTTDTRTPEEQTKERAGCRFHLCLTLPFPESELAVTGYDTYYVMLRKLVHAHLRTMHGSLTAYQGEVSPIGNVLLQQVIFFSRIIDKHKSLAKWLIMAEVKPGDPAILFPLLRDIKTHLETNKYLTEQKHQLGNALVSWVKKVLSDEFKMLHSTLPGREGLLELARLENFLRCFNTVEQCYELKFLFKQKAAQYGHNLISDLLEEVIVKHADTWVEALSKEKLQQKGGAKNDADDVTTPTSNDITAWVVWKNSLRRASIVTEPVMNFLNISFSTYQPIFTNEISMDYMYLVMPRMVKAVVHILNPLLKFDVDGAVHHIAANDIAAAAQATWVLITHLSSINKIGIDSHLPQHQLHQNYRSSFAEVMRHWMALSKHLGLQEFHKDIQEDQFTPIDHSKGYSQSAVGVADLMKAMMGRLCGVQWPGDVGPALTTLQTMAQQLMELAAQYAEEVTHSYINIGTQGNSIPPEVCVVVRNVEYVCNEVRKHLLHLSNLAGEAQEVVHQLHERITHLQEHVENSAETLLRHCLPFLEKLVTRAVKEGDLEHIIQILEEAIDPVKDRIYFAVPLLHQLWYRLVDHVEQLKAFYVQGDDRENLRLLRVVMKKSHDFLTDEEGVGLTLLDEVTQKYESIQADLKLLGATSAELMSQFYNIRYQDQMKEDTDTARVLVLNAIFTKNGLRVHVVQAPGSGSAGSLVKARLEPSQWFPSVEPLKTHLVKGDPAIFDEVLEFPGVLSDCKEGGGVLTLQIRSPRLLSSSIVHDETILPLSDLMTAPDSKVLHVPHLRMPLTRPWDFKSYKPLEALMTRSQDKAAVEFLKTLSDRWKSGETTDVISDNNKLLSSFPRAGSVRSIKSAVKKGPRRGTVIKS